MSPPRESAGILLFRQVAGRAEVLLAHPGGPFWARKDEGAWSVPKGEVDPEEDELAAARREFEEETGLRLEGPFIDLGEVRQRAGKRVRAWGCEGDVDPGECRSNPVTIEWPKGSGRSLTFPEVDRCEWFGLAEAERRINPAQAAFLERLAARIANGSG
jgi:predicted NUDIX family NTP pyrophosphohydrolase